MDTEHNLIEIKSENIDIALPHHCAKDIETDEPTCLIHLKVQKSDDIEIIARGAPRNLPSIKSETFIDNENIKQEQLEDIKGDGLMSVNDIKIEELGEIDIENDGFVDTDVNKQDPKEGVRYAEVEDQINIQRDRFTDGNGETERLEDIKSKESEGAARDEKRPLDGRKHFECNICQRTFTHKGNLNGHLRTHTGEKPFECDICQRGFTAKCDLSKHLKIHTREKPFECQTCQRRFSQRYSLNAHLRIHTGEKPFECKLCLRTFCRRSSLSTHMKTHVEKSFECETCKQKFAFNGHYCPGPPLPPYIPIDPDLITQVPHVEYVGIPRLP